ncbi:hypothetical protein ACOZ4N_00260 (plasmid) [Halorientalis pallida]|uniref:hypothetical protein n=1 Tax=Halorientalis pallida TaxID=2479928 RepID=UPI003C6FAB6A
MTDVLEKVEVIQQAGEITLDLLEIGFPPAGYGCPEDENGTPILEEDERYWSAFKEIESRLETFGSVEFTDEFLTPDNPFLSLTARKSLGGGVFCQYNINYGADGVGTIVVEYRMNEGWHTAIDHHPSELHPVDVGRYVARAELSLLANELESPTETLDYWVVEGSDYHDSEFSQSRWAKVRNVSRQTVNDRVQSARGKLTDET